MTRDILSIIQTRMNTFSKGQKLIARFILESYDKAAFMTASRLGKTVNVSESTVVRFAAELGYDGYPSMQKALQEMIRNKLTSIQRIEVANDRIGNQDVLSMVMQSDIEKIRMTMEETDRESFKAAVDAILAAKRDAQSIESADVQHALDTLLFGMERPGASRLAHEREVTAAHEAGHAILTAVLLPQSEIRKVSIIPKGRGAAGYSMAVPQEKLFHEKRELMHHIAVALAGREAEALLLGPERVSTGASNDIEKAALIAQRMVCEWGMLPLSDEVCLFSQQQKDQAAQQWLSQGRLLAAGTLRAHQAAWERLTRLLMERESVDGEEVARCLEA